MRKRRSDRADPAGAMVRAAARREQTLARGLQHHQAGQLDSAAACYHEVLRGAPREPNALHLLGVVALQTGRLADAETAIRAALTEAPDQPTFWNSLGAVERSAGRFAEAAASFERAVLLAPAYGDAWAGLAAAREALADAAGEALALERVTALLPGQARAWGRRGVLAYQAGDLSTARDCFAEAARLAPDDADVWTNLGAVQLRLGSLDEAESSQRRAIALRPDSLAAHNNLGNVLVARSRWDEAAAILEQVAERAPDDANVWINLAHALKGIERHAEARAAYERALALRSDDPAALVGLGDALQGLGETERALAYYERALALGVQDADAFDHYGVGLQRLGRLSEAVDWYERALALRPDAVQIYDHLGNALQRLGRLQEAVTAYRRSLDLAPDRPTVHTTLIFLLDLLEDAEDQASVERRRWNARFGRPRSGPVPAFLNDPSPDRPLRVGYVSADFHHHSMSFIVLPILESHDHRRVSVVCYSGVTTPDAMTARFRTATDLWRDVAGRSDDELEAQIRTDQIDILVDLSGHTDGNRLTVFARRPAPVQVTAWGYATGTGLEAMDYFLADPIVVPPESHNAYAEEVVNLPSVVCYAPTTQIPPVTPPPVIERGYVTFGAFNRLTKVTSGAVAAWARILHAVPSSRLIIKAGGPEPDTARQQLADVLVALGVDSERIEVRGNTSQFEHVAAHADVDLMLDSFPHGGGVTTLDALLMGVPVVTLLGQRVAGRISASFLTTLSLDDLVAQTLDEYVSIAVRLAGDLDRLSGERATLRERLLVSPIGNAPQYTRAVEDVYGNLWRRWCLAQQHQA